MDGVAPGSAEPVLPESAALLVAGADPERPARVRELAVVIGALDQTLRSTRGRWAIRRLTAAGDERVAPTRVGIKHALEALGRGTPDVAVVAIAGTVTGAGGAPALITGPAYRTYLEEATLPLAWIGQRLAAMDGAERIVVVSARPDDAAPPVEAWLAALAPAGPAVIVEASERPAVIEALCGGLRGGAIDPETGTVTVRSLVEYLARAAPGARARAAPRPKTIIRPASLDDLRALGWSRPAAAAPAMPATDDGPAAEGDLRYAVLRGEIRVDDELARGSFGVVYRARQLLMGRDVALKVLPPGIDAQSEDGALFLDEIRAVARIDHPNVVRVFHADETYDGRLFYAMELLSGEDLDALADRGPVPPARAIALAVQLLAGLAAAHAAGLIHADIKPGNAFVTRGSTGAGERVVLLDFGLARLARAGGPADSAGGTPQYMAPEQLTQRRVDERSDVFSAALVLVTLLTGWRRRRASELVPPLERVADEALRAVLARALALDPAERYPRAADFAAALAALGDGAAAASPAVAPDEDRLATGSARSEPQPPQPPPFRRLRAFSERDRDRFFGRDREVAGLLDQVLAVPAIIYTAPSGVGKTSLLRAGLLPRLEALGGRGVYVACHAGTRDAEGAIRAALGGDAPSLAEAWAAPAASPPGRRVLVLDQIEAVLAGDETAADGILQALLGAPALAGERDQAVVLSVREDFLGRLVDRLQPHAPGVAILRLPPLTPAGAREALVRPLAARRLAIEDALLEQLLADLTAAAGSLGAEMGWGAAQAVYPPHLQLAGARLYEALPAEASTLTLRQYRELGGIDEIVRGHLTHVLESELARDQVPIARELFKHMITPAQTRAAPTEAELIAVAAPASAAPASAAEVAAVLEALRHHGLAIRLARGHREPSWELIHDSLIPRIQAWMDEHDLERRRAIELLRHHARQSRPEAPSLIAPRELRALRAAPDAIEVVEREWRGRAALTESAWTPRRLVAHARAVHLRRRLAIGAAAAGVLAALAVAGGAWWSGRRAEERRQAQVAANLGRFELELAPFDWDPAGLAARPVPIAELPRLRWRLLDPDPADLDAPGEEMRSEVTLAASAPGDGGRSRVDSVEAPGRAAFLAVDGRGRRGARCAPSIVPIRMLPGFAQRGERRRLRVAVPTCAATAAGMVAIPAGPFRSAGAGEPPSAYAARKDGPPAATLDLPRYAMDRTEVTNAAFDLFDAMAELTGIARRSYPATTYLRDAGKPAYPANGMPWRDARAYCAFLGKALPTSPQWEKALRGGLVLAVGAPNPHPARNLPWGAPRPGAAAKLRDVPPDGPAPVGTFPDDVGPDGVVDLAGNVSEWTRSLPLDGNRAFRVIRGGNWEQTDAATLVDFMAIQNMRPLSTTSYSLGFRCALDAPAP